MSLSAYDLAIQTAFKEVADALAVRGTIHERLDAQAALVDAASESYRLADELRNSLLTGVTPDHCTTSAPPGYKLTLPNGKQVEVVQP